MATIEKVWAREVLDSRGNPTVEAVLTVKGHELSAIAPSGASTGTWEAHELRDGGERYGGKGVQTAVKNIRGPIAQKIVGMDPTDQAGIDAVMAELDGSGNMANLGGNATTAVSMAVARAGAFASNQQLYEYIGRDHVTLPVPMFNIVNGGKHAGGDLKIQECLIMPIGAPNFREALRMASETYMVLKKILRDRYGVGAINVGDEGGFAPPVNTVAEALQAITDAITAAGYEPGQDISLAIDAASSEFYHSGKYSVDGLTLTADKLADHYGELVDQFPLYSIEDPFQEDDFAGTAAFTRQVGNRIQIIGDDLFVTNAGRLQRGIDEGAANALLLKVNQIGTISAAQKARELSAAHGYNVVVSHRSGETEDTTIADLTVGWGTGQIKTGAPCRGERTAKYNRLLRIEERLGDKAVYPGRRVLKV